MRRGTSTTARSTAGHARSRSGPAPGRRWSPRGPDYNAWPVNTREPLDAILRTRAGKLQETPYPMLLIALALREKSAVLALNRNQLHKEIVFDSGSPVDCRSNIATETFGRFLVAMGK